MSLFHLRTFMPCVWETRLQIVCVLHDAVHGLYQVFLLSVCHTVACYMCKCNFIYAHKKNTSFPVMIVMKFTYTEQHCGCISDTEFHLNWTMNVGSMDRYY